MTEYTREAGVRQLERELGKVLRKTATQIASETATAPVVGRPGRASATRSGRQKFFQEAAERTAVPGVATGLAVTGTGGDVLFVEATGMPGGQGRPRADRPARRRDEGVGADRALLRARPRGRAGHRPSTRSRTASSTCTCPRGRSRRTARAPGVTMTTALASLLSAAGPVKHTVGMTGEVTLQGRVLPIGGLKQKVLAAHAAGITDVILPERNRARPRRRARARARRDDVPPGHDDRRGAGRGARAVTGVRGRLARGRRTRPGVTAERAAA